MVQSFKLVGLLTYTGTATKDAIVRKGEVCRFDAGVAEKIIKGGRRNQDGEVTPYFVEVPESETVTHDFTTKATTETATATTDESAAPVPAKVSQRARRPA